MCCSRRAGSGSQFWRWRRRFAEDTSRVAAGSIAGTRCIMPSAAGPAGSARDTDPLLAGAGAGQAAAGAKQQLRLSTSVLNVAYESALEQVTWAAVYAYLCHSAKLIVPC